MSRQAIAYLLIALIVLAMAAGVAWTVYQSRDRRISRQRNREQAHRARRGGAGEGG